MKILSAEVTRYMMDAMAYAFVACTVAATGEEPTDKEIESHVRSLMALYCRSEGIVPTYDGIASGASAPDCYACCKRTEADGWHDDEEDEEEEDDWDDDDDEDYEGEDEDEDEDEDTHEAPSDSLTAVDLMKAFISFLDANRDGK